MAIKPCKSHRLPLIVNQLNAENPEGPYLMAWEQNGRSLGLESLLREKPHALPWIVICMNKKLLCCATEILGLFVKAAHVNQPNLYRFFLCCVFNDLLSSAPYT